MGRKKIRIARITDERNRSVTYLKRKAGLMKKAHELAVLTESEVAVIVFGKNGKLAEFCSTDIDQLLLRYTQHDGAVESKGPSFYFAQAANAADSDDEGEEEEESASVKRTSPGPANDDAATAAGSATAAASKEEGPTTRRGSKRKASDDGSVSGRAAQKRPSTGAGLKEEESSNAGASGAVQEETAGKGKGKIKVALAQRRQSKEGAASTSSAAPQQQQQLPPPQLHMQPQQQPQQPHMQAPNGMPRPYALDGLANNVMRPTADMLGSMGSSSNPMRSSPRFGDVPSPSLNLQPLEPGNRHHYNMGGGVGSSNQGYNTYTGPGPLTAFPPPQLQQQHHGAWGGMQGNAHGGRQLSLNAALEARAMGGYGELAGGRSAGAGDAFYQPIDAAQYNLAHHGGGGGKLIAPVPYKEQASHYAAYPRPDATLAQPRHSLPLQGSPPLGYALSPQHAHAAPPTGAPPPNAVPGAAATAGMSISNAAFNNLVGSIMSDAPNPLQAQGATSIQHTSAGTASASQQQQQQHAQGAMYGQQAQAKPPS